MKKIAMALCAFLFAGAAFAAPFADVPRGHWAYGAIEKCVEAGILQGYDGKFNGKQLLNRYQIAVIVAKMLDKVQDGAPAGSKMSGEAVKNLEALMVEFADELAQLNVKVSTLEDNVAKLKADVAAIKGAGPAKVQHHNAGGFGLQGFASFALVMTEEDAGRTNPAAQDSTYFTNPQVALAINKDLGQGVTFKLRLAHESDVSTPGSDAAIDQAYFQVDQLLGENVGGKVGAFTFEEFSMETNGAFATTDYTVTESFLNRGLRTFHAYGVEFAKNEKKMAAGDVDVRFGVLSGTDGNPAGTPGVPGVMLFSWMTNDETGSIEAAREADDSFGYYLFLNKKRAECPFGWNFLYYDNGSDASDATAAADEQDFMMLGLNYAKDDLEVILQYLDGSATDADSPNDEVDYTSMFILFNYKLDEKQSLSLRYETFEAENGAGTLDEFDALTFAWNRKITSNSMLQFEFLMVDDDVVAPATDDEDDLIQLRYKVWF